MTPRDILDKEPLIRDDESRTRELMAFLSDHCAAFGLAVAEDVLHPIPNVTTDLVWHNGEDDEAYESLHVLRMDEIPFAIVHTPAGDGEPEPYVTNAVVARNAVRAALEEVKTKAFRQVEQDAAIPVGGEPDIGPRGPS